MADVRVGSKLKIDFGIDLDCSAAMQPRCFFDLADRRSNAWIVTKRKKLLPKFLYHITGRCMLCDRKNGWSGMTLLPRTVASSKAAGGTRLPRGVTRIEAPNARESRRRRHRGGGGWGGAVPLPNQLGGLGEHRELPQRGPGRSPGRQWIFWHIWGPQNSP